MKLPRWPLILGLVVSSAVLGYLLRDLIYQLVVVPTAYLLWLLNFYYSAIPQWIVWSVLLGVLFIVVLWSLLPEGRVSSRREPKRPRPEGEVEALAVWLGKAREGNYFKWQIANRLGRIGRRLDDMAGPRGRAASDDAAVEKYLDAGLNYSFVDFLTPSSPLGRAARTPLDLDPGRAADYLESQMEKSRERRG